jgi:hypothetical protein
MIRIVAIFFIIEIYTLFQIVVAGKFTNFLRVKFHMPDYSNALIMDIKSKVREHLCMAIILLLCMSQ